MKPKFRTASFVSLILSILIAAVWVVQTLIAYQDHIKRPEYSAPFWVYQLPELIAYGIPLIIGLVLSVMFSRKQL